jgi:hypothetical protein
LLDSQSQTLIQNLWEGGINVGKTVENKPSEIFKKGNEIPERQEFALWKNSSLFLFFGFLGPQS